jgi:chemotaxis protein methyltransferase CheR
MPGLLERPISYRHVVFPGSAEPVREAFNFTPVPIVFSPSATELGEDEQDLVRWIFSEAKLRLSDYRPETIKRRIPACLRAMRLERISQIRPAIHRKPELLNVAISSLLIGVTSFFRDPSVFESLPEVLSRIALTVRSPRIWSAACSDGAELYSVAMLLAEIGAVQRSTLLGTDYRSDAIMHARQGLYDAGSIKTVPPRYLTRYLRAELGNWRIHPYLRSITEWRASDVTSQCEEGEWDVILCRNLSIYLQPVAAGKLWSRLERALKPGGYLILGKAERPFGIHGLRAIGPCMYQRVGN